MKDPLATYLADHLAGSLHAIELVKNLRDEYRDDELGRFANRLLGDIEADRDTLQGIADRADTGSSQVKEAGAWLAEKVSRLKFSHEGKDSLGTFEALEHLALGIQGKLALWRVLGMLAGTDPRLQGVDFEGLARRASDQHTQVEERRLDLGQHALARQAGVSA